MPFVTAGWSSFETHWSVHCVVNLPFQGLPVVNVLILGIIIGGCIYDGG